MLRLVPPRPTGIVTDSAQLLQQKRFALAELLRGTEAMLENAKRGDWNAVESMELTRKEDLVEYFRRNDKENKALLSDVITTMIAMNDQIAELVTKAKLASSSEKQKLDQGKKAAGSYLQFQDSKL